jgi:GNAT superfamily N-acetyltransferase
MTPKYNRAYSRTVPSQLETRIATPADAPEISASVAEGFDGYREWAPAAWRPLAPTPEMVATLRSRLSDADVWCLLALDGAAVVGHVALAATSGEEPEPAPPGTTNLWQLFVRRHWHGSGIAMTLMRAAVAEAGRRGFTTMRLWTPRGAARARRFYEREGWTPTGAVHEQSPTGLVTVQYERAVGAS